MQARALSLRVRELRRTAKGREGLAKGLVITTIRTVVGILTQTPPLSGPPPRGKGDGEIDGVAGFPQQLSVQQTTPAPPSFCRVFQFVQYQAIL